jgi:hypothetical protein
MRRKITGPTAKAGGKLALSEWPAHELLLELKGIVDSGENPRRNVRSDPADSSDGSKVVADPAGSNPSGCDLFLEFLCRHYQLLDQLKKRALKQFKFSTDELYIISVLFGKLTKGICTNVSAVDLLCRVYGSQSEALAHVGDLVRLAKDGIVYFYQGSSSNNPSMPRSIPIESQIVALKYSIDLKEEFWAYVLKGRKQRASRRGYSSTAEFMADATKLVEARLNTYDQEHPSRRRALLYTQPAQRLQQMERRLNRTKFSIPLLSLTHEYGLDFAERLTLIYLFDKMKLRLKPSLDALAMIVDTDACHRDNMESILDPTRPLLKNGLIEYSTSETPMGVTHQISLDPAVFKRLAGLGGSSSEPTAEEVIRGSAMVHMVAPTATLPDLIVPDQTRDIIMTCLHSQSTDGQATLSDWGILRHLSGTESGSRGTLILLHGKPGTGKTICGHVIANELGKKLLTVDVAQVFDKYIGESQKNLRRVFATYNRLFDKTPNPPILFLNECDQLLCHRHSDLGNYSDRMLNQMQGMLLEFFENFKGVCVCTTNIVTSMDAAYSRRFTHKIEIPMPDCAARQRLWSLHIGTKLPLADDLNTDLLAQRYPFSGGQIRLVIENTAREVAQRPECERRFHQRDFVKWAELECSGAFDQTSTHLIGFREAC